MATNAMGYALSALNALAGSEILDRLGMRKSMERLTYNLTKTGFEVGSTAARKFSGGGKSGKPERLDAPGMTTDLFDLSITEEQQMVRDNISSFAAKELREKAELADENCVTAPETLTAAEELGLSFFSVPESLGGAAGVRSTVTSMLIAEDLAHGDMGQAIAILAPISVANAITAWGTAGQQEKYLPAFIGDNSPKAAIAVCEPEPLFDPTSLSTTAKKEGDRYILNGTKSMVPVAAEAEIFLIAAATDSGPAVFIVEGGTEGLSIGEDPGMGIRAAAMRPIKLDNVSIPLENKLGTDDFNYQSFIDLGTLAWCALACGCRLSTSPSPRHRTRSRMPSSA